MQSFFPLYGLFPRCASREGTGWDPAHEADQRWRVGRNPWWPLKLSQATLGDTVGPAAASHPEIRGGQEQSEGPLRETGIGITGGWGSRCSMWEAPKARSQGQDCLNITPLLHYETLNLGARRRPPFTACWPCVSELTAQALGIS